MADVDDAAMALFHELFGVTSSAADAVVAAASVFDVDSGHLWELLAAELRDEPPRFDAKLKARRVLNALSLSQCPTTPRELLLAALDVPECTWSIDESFALIAAAVAGHPAADTEVLDRLVHATPAEAFADAPTMWVWATVAAHPALGEATAIYMVEQPWQVNQSTLDALVSRPRLPEPIAEAILTATTRSGRMHQDAPIRMKLAEHPDASRSMLERLRSDRRSDVGVRAGVRLSKM